MRNVLITGTSTGIGEACTRHFAGRGDTVFAGVRREEDAARLTAQITGAVRPVILDVSNGDDITRVIAEVTREVGTEGLAGLVNNAGVGVGGPFEYLDEADWRWVFDVNFFGIVALTKAALPLLETGRGRIVHIGSIGGRIASPGLGPYCASKHALEALAESQRVELARSGSPIRVSLVEPGEVATAIWDKAEASVDDIERNLDAEGKRRYQWLLDQSRGFVDEGRTKGVPAAKVADVVEHALTADRPKARYLVGADAKLAGHLVTRLPDRLRDTFAGLGSKRWETRGAKLNRHDEERRSSLDTGAREADRGRQAADPQPSADVRQRRILRRRPPDRASGEPMEFVQLMECRTSKVDELTALEAEWRHATEGRRTLRRSVVARDRNDPDRYFILAFFDSYDSAMANSNLPETAAFGAKQAEVLDEPMKFTDLDIIEDQT